MLTINPETSGRLISIKGSVQLGVNDHFCVYDGIGIKSIIGCYAKSFTILSETGPLTIAFTTGYSSGNSGFYLFVACACNSISIYGLIKRNKNQTISFDKNWKIIEIKYQYRGNYCYICPYGTSNINFTCYSNNVLEKCEQYSIESEYENLCIKCKNNYYPMLNDKTNKNNFINCYQNNSLEQYYLGNDDFFFKSCYESCKTCIKNGTVENHNCLSCDINYGFNLTSGDYYNCYPECDTYYYFDNDKNFICLNKTECPNNYNNLIEEKNQCIDNCENDPEYKFNFRKKCYKECPVGISYESKTQKYFCEVNCNKSMPFEIIEYQTCVQNCSIWQLNNKICKINFKSDNKNDTDTAQEKMVNDIKEEMIKGIDTSGIDEGENIVIQEEDVTVTITKNSNQKNEINKKTNTTSIDLGDCETLLKDKYNIPENESLYILKMDVKQDGYKIPKIQYEVYYPLYNDSKLYLLNLSICKDINIDIYLPMSLNLSLDEIDPNSKFYNDICTTYTTENGTDLTLSERKKIISIKI